MELNEVTLGQTITASVDFFDSQGNPFIAKSAASYVIKDFNGNMVISGLGQQDGMYPQTWTANITIPDSAPYDPAKKYAIIWSVIGGSDGNQTNTVRQLFSVVPSVEVFENKYPELVVPTGTKIADTLLLDPKDNITNISLRLLDSQDNIYETQANANITPQNVDGNNAYYYEFQTEDLSSSFTPYIVQWQYMLNGRIQFEYHFVYVASTRMIMLMEELRNFIDKIRFSHPNPNLRYKDADLMYYLLQGLMILNGTKPQVTSWSISNFPVGLDWYLVNAAAYVALSAQYLAEGVSAFDFSGQSVTLNVDRSASIDSALGRVSDVIQNQFPTVKSNLIKASTPGVLWLTYSPSFNENIGVFGRVNGLLGDFYARINYYDGIANNITPIPM